MNATTLVIRSIVVRAMRLCMAVVLLGAGAHAQAGLSFQLAVATHNEPGPGASNVPPDEARTSQVVLGEPYLSITTPATAQIFDFASRRRYQVDLQTHTYVDYSLFDTVGMRVMEVKNRENLRRMLAAAGIDKPASDPVFDEQALSVLSQPARTMTEAADGADTVLSVDGKALLRIGTSGTAVSASDAAAFARFLRYQFGGHPLALAKLVSLRRIPSTFVMYYREVGGTQTLSFTIKGLTLTAPPSYDITAFSERAGGGDEIDQLLDRARHATRSTREEIRLKFDADMTTAFAEKRPLDAMLGAVEWMLMSGTPMAPFPAEQQAMLQADPSVRAVRGALNPSDKAGLNAAVQVMQSMQPQTMNKRHMLQLFEANDRAKLGDRSTALQLFASVLRANPALAGAYKDMGDTLFVGFDMPRAWRSWDEGRRIAPGLNLFAAVNQFEQLLLREHPEYF
ncbi:MAG: hypothetical protein JWP34_1701 [Massilia sp.]|nr:hypothetical protein [Massilia sp.]